MDDFGDNFDQPEVDPAADFLAREQNQLAGLEDELEPVPPPQTTSALLDDFVVVKDDHVSPETVEPEPTYIRQDREEPEKIKKWREEQKARLEQKDADEETKKDEMRKAAKKELEDWYTTHEEQISKTKAANRNAERALAAHTEPPVEAGGEWERIAALCDFNPKAARGSRDVSRLRSIVLQLKQAGVLPQRPPSTNTQA